MRDCAARLTPDFAPLLRVPICPMGDGPLPRKARRTENDQKLMSSVHCANCGYELRDVDHTPCPKCGDSRRTVNLEARAQMGLTANVRMTMRRLEEEIKRNWPLITVLALGDLISTIPAYFLSGWASVAVAFGFVFFSTIVGYFAVTRVIKITTETK